MAGRKRIGGGGLQRGLEDTIRQAVGDDDAIDQQQTTTARATRKAGEFTRKTYLLTDALIDEVRQTARAHDVGINEFVRWALGYVVVGVNSGEIEIPTKAKGKRIVE